MKIMKYYGTINMFEAFFEDQLIVYMVFEPIIYARILKILSVELNLLLNVEIQNFEISSNDDFYRCRCP